MVVVLGGGYTCKRTVSGVEEIRASAIERCCDMRVGETYMLRNFDRDPCPICGEPFSRCGLPNHIRRHTLSGTQRLKRKAAGRKSAAWWDGWKEGYKAGLQDGGLKSDERS
jgi:hypothetical protein